MHRQAVWPEHHGAGTVIGDGPTGRTAYEAWDGQLVDDEDQAPAPHETTEDFDAFWATHRARKQRPTATIRGVLVAVPDGVPLEFEDLYEQAQHRADPATYARLIAHLFGEDTYGAWKRAGMTTPELQVVLAWGMANAAGRRMGFAEAARLVADAEATKSAAGKAPRPNRAARRRGSSGTR